jgi:hypothetical protein
MSRFLSAVLLAIGCSSANGAEDITLQEWLDMFVDSCVGGGSSFFVSGGLDAAAGLSLKKLNAGGSIVGQVKVTKSTYRLLSEGISNAMSEVAAGQADKVRECLAPLRQNLLEAMNRQMGVASPLSKPVHILSPHEEKVLKALANQRGEDGKTGKNVAKDKILTAAQMSDIRFGATIRQLQSKVLATESKYPKLLGAGGSATIQMVEVVSLWDDGEEYVLKMGYAR